MDSLEAQKRLACEAYGEAVIAVRRAYRLGARDSSPAAVEGLLGLLRQDNSMLLALTARSTAGHYLYAHSVNVAVLCMHIVRRLGCSEEIQRRLGLCALHLDLDRMRPLLAASRQGLSQEDLETRLHPAPGGRIFDYAAALEGSLPATLAEIYTTEYGSQELEHRNKRRPLHQGAHIMALCEAYESQTHVRRWREGALPHAVLMSILQQFRRESDQKLVKAFAESLTVYPPGSYVELSGRQIGCVLRVHPQSPTRPMVRVCALSDGTSVDSPYLVDLMEQSHIQVQKAVDETKLPLKGAMLRLRLQAARWWIS